MPGIFGIITPDAPDLLASRLSRGINRLLHQPWSHTRSHLAPPFGVAVALRGEPLAGGDLWAAPEGDLVVGVDGELYAGPQSHTDPPPLFPTPHCAAYIGHLYREHGSKWVEQVRGAFAVAIWDGGEPGVHLYVDRYGLRPLYYTHIGQHFIFSSNMAAITAAWPEAGWQLNLDAVADFFTFEHVLGEKSYLKDVTLLPNAGSVHYNFEERQLSHATYWSLSELPFQANSSFDEAVKQACDLFGQALDEQLPAQERPGIYLTGGLDSRTTAGFLKRCRTNFVTCTYGLTGSRDVVWGGALAKRVGSQHHFFPMDDGAWVFRYASEFVASTEAFVNCFHSHGISTYETARKMMDVHLSGYGGGSFAGGDTTSVAALAAGTHRERAEEMYKTYLFGLGNVYRTSFEQDYLFQPELRHKIVGRAETSFRQEFEKYATLRPDIIGDAFTLCNRYKKMFAYIIANERNYLEDRAPFMDYRFLDFIFSLPTSIRLERQLQLGMIEYGAPELVWVPWQTTATLPTRRRWLQVGYKLGRRILGITSGYSLPTEPGRNYPKWLHEHGLLWASEILDSDRLQARGILERTYLRELINRVPRAIEYRPYQQQRSLAYRIGAAVTFELMCRRVFDGE